MGSCQDQAGIPQRFENGRFGWFWSTRASTTPSGRRFGRLPTRLGVVVHRFYSVGCSGPPIFAGRIPSRKAHPTIRIRSLPSFQLSTFLGDRSCPQFPCPAPFRCLKAGPDAPARRSSRSSRLPESPWHWPEVVWSLPTFDRFVASATAGIATRPGRPLPGQDSFVLDQRAFTHGAHGLLQGILVQYGAIPTRKRAARSRRVHPRACSTTVTSAACHCTTFTGVSRSIVVPSPSWPLSFSPQQ